MLCSFVTASWHSAVAQLLAMIGAMQGSTSDVLLVPPVEAPGSWPGSSAFREHHGSASAMGMMRNFAERTLRTFPQGRSPSYRQTDQSESRVTHQQKNMPWRDSWEP